MGFNLTPAGNDGYWGPITASLDWCEENYIHSHYVAEFFNTITNFWYHIFAILGWIMCFRVAAEVRSHLVFVGLFLVGVGSFMFHASLLFETQMADELPMIYCTCIQVYSILMTFPSERSKRPLIIAGLLLYSGLVTSIYIQFRNPVFHEVSYALLVLISIVVPLRQIYHFKTTYPDRFGGLIALFIGSLSSYATGFLLWNVENQTCDHIRAARNDLGYPFRVLLELHGWWHFLTAVGCYGGGLMTVYIRMLAIGRTDVQLRWLVFPYLVTKLTKEEQDAANAAALKYKSAKGKTE
ncbi:Alkaline ceramidase 3 [Phlyctochytrium bullatum]|nr:Alkaline ceramidase 3 [Phlyctochytrium bullatum]